MWQRYTVMSILVIVLYELLCYFFSEFVHCWFMLFQPGVHMKQWVARHSSPSHQHYLFSISHTKLLSVLPLTPWPVGNFHTVFCKNTRKWRRIKLLGIPSQQLICSFLPLTLFQPFSSPHFCYFIPFSKRWLSKYTGCLQGLVWREPLIMPQSFCPPAVDGARQRNLVLHSRGSWAWTIEVVGKRCSVEMFSL